MFDEELIHAVIRVEDSGGGLSEGGLFDTVCGGGSHESFVLSGAGRDG